MKKYFYFLLLLMAINVQAQNVPNGNFENWISHGAYSFPQDWRTTDSISTSFEQQSVIQDTDTVYSGHSAMKMQCWSISVDTLPAVATNGNINYATFPIIQFINGSPDSVRNNVLTGWYIYNPVGGDSCTISVLLTKWNGTARDTIGAGVWFTKNAVSDYTQFTMPIIYTNPGNPDTVLIVVLSSPLFNSHIGTILHIDDLNFSGINGINELSSNLVSVIAFPNPASDYITVEAKWKTAVKSTISISDMNGRLIEISPMVESTQRIDISSLANGNYFYNLIDESGTKLYSGKFSVSR